jgi:hypothetical protein
MQLFFSLTPYPRKVTPHATPSIDHRRFKDSLCMKGEFAIVRRFDPFDRVTLFSGVHAAPRKSILTKANITPRI